MRLLRVAVLVAACVTCSRPASGQAEPDPRADARFHVGPLYLTPTISITNLGVDNNVFNSAEAPESDFTFSLRQDLDAAVPFGRKALLTATGAVTVDYYRRFSRERAVSGNLVARLEHYLSRMTIFLEAGEESTRQRPNFEIDARLRREHRSGSAGVSVRVFRKLYLEPSVAVSEARFDATAIYDGVQLRDTLGRDTRTGRLAARWRATPLTSFGLRVEAEADRFPWAPERNADTARVTAGVDMRPRALVSGSANVGVQRFRTLSRKLPDDEGLFAQATLAYRIVSSTSLELTAKRDVGYSYQVREPYYVVKMWGLVVRRHLGSSFAASLGALRNWYAYRPFDQAFPAVEDAALKPGRVDLTWNYTASISHGSPRDRQVGVAASYVDRQSSTKRTLAYNSTRVGMFVVQRF